MMLESCSWLAQIQQKKICPKQMDQVQDISNPVQVGGVLKSSGDPLDDGRRYFKNDASYAEYFTKNKCANLNDANCMMVVWWCVRLVTSS